MVGFAVVLLILAVAAIVFGVIVYGNGIGLVPDEPGAEPTATRRGVARISWRDLFARLGPSARQMLDEQADRGQRLAATGAFCVLVGLVLLALAVLAIVAAAL